MWPLNVGQVYTTLQRLERDELIESDDRGEEAGPQKVFHITDGRPQGARHVVEHATGHDRAAP